MTSGPPPDEPTLRSDPCLLSPASPKPIHFPKPTNIPILDLQTDVAFNQTERHMADPAMHNTELRPGAWQDPSEQQQPDVETSILSASVGEPEDDIPDSTEQSSGQLQAEGASARTEAAENASAPEPVQLSNQSPDDNPIPSTENDDHNASATTDEPSMPDTSVLAANGAPPYDPFQTQSDEVKLEQQPPAAFGGLDVQSFLKSLQTAPTAGALSTVALAPPGDPVSTATTLSPGGQPQPPPPPGVVASPLSASGLAAPPAGLPARPPPQEQPLIHPNYVHSQHLQDYHPHASYPAFQPHTRSSSSGVADAAARNFVPPVQSPSQSTTTQAAVAFQQPTPTSASQPTPNSGQFPYAPYPGPAPQQAAESKRESLHVSGPSLHSSDEPWSPETQHKYDDFLSLERQYVQEGRWEQFPVGSRLFVGTRDLHGRKTTYEEDRLNALAGNLSSEKVTKRDIFHVFHRYGRLAQISIKQAYGFVQFFNADDCRRALDGEQGRVVRDKRIHLEISKPQKSRQPANRRSRSPDHGRGNPPPSTDRYVSGSSRGGGRGSRDGYRPNNYRSPSPRGYRDRYDDRYRGRSPPGYGNRRYRSPSPRRGALDDDLPLPKRLPKDVPDVQILVLDSLDRDFIAWVEKSFTSRGIRVDVLLLSPRLEEQAVIRRQIVEGVLAVCKLDHRHQRESKIDIQLFDRRGGQNNVQFEEYQALEPQVAAELVLRARNTHAAPSSYGGGYAPPAQQSYGGYAAQPTPTYGQPQPAYPSYQQQPPAGAPGPQPNLQNLITNLDPAGLHNLLSAMNGKQNMSATPQQPGSAVFPGYPPVTQYGQQQQDALAALNSNPALAGLLQQQQQQPPTQQRPPPATTGAQVNMQDILARLGTGR